MPLALLLSPDDQAVSAITAVLEEMSVTCERPLDGVSAAEKLNSSNFDLVLVDCENLPAAKLIFDVCRRGKDGHSPVPIAIVDGRAGLPTAFRLGAELILTKPVAKDQARSTIRTGVGRLKKEDLVPTPSAGVTSEIDAGQTNATHAPAGESRSGKIVGDNEMAAGLASAPDSGPRAMAASATAAPSETVGIARPLSVSTSGETTLKPASFTDGSAAIPGPEPTPVKKASVLDEVKMTAPRPSDDPVLAELEKPDAQRPAQIFSSYAPGGAAPEEKKSPGPLVAALVLILLGAGGYGAWTYVPGFRAAVEPRVDQVRALVGQAHSHAEVSAPVVQPTPAVATPSAAPTTPAESAQSVSPTADGSSPSAPLSVASTDPSAVPESSGVGATTSSAPTGAAPASSAPGSTSSVAPSATVVSSSKGATATMPGAASASTGKSGPDVNISIATGADAKGAAPTKAGDNSQRELPGEKTAVVLSSKGAEKRLSHFVKPVYPAETRSAGSEGTVVLKTVVDELGNVAGLQTIEGDTILANAAMKAVKQWRYRPYLRDGKAVPFQTIVLVDFQKP